MTALLDGDMRQARDRLELIGEAVMTRFTDDDVIKMRSMLWHGATLQEVADIFGTSKEYVRQVKANLIRKGIGINASRDKPVKAEREKRKRIPLGNGQRIVARRMRHDGHTYNDIAEHLGVSATTIRRITKDVEVVTSKLGWRNPKRRR